jgi:hypothetical protein
MVQGQQGVCSVKDVTQLRDLCKRIMPLLVWDEPNSTTEDTLRILLKFMENPTCLFNAGGKIHSKRVEKM